MLTFRCHSEPQWGPERDEGSSCCDPMAFLWGRVVTIHSLGWQLDPMAFLDSTTGILVVGPSWILLLIQVLVHVGQRCDPLDVHPLWIAVAGPQEEEIDFIILGAVSYTHFALGLQIM